jgi:hypothetical protein
MSTVRDNPLISETSTTPIGQRWHQSWQSACAGVIIALARMAFLVRSSWTNPTMTAPSGHRHEANGGGDRVVERGHNDNDEGEQQQ